MYEFTFNVPNGVLFQTGNLSKIENSFKFYYIKKINPKRGLSEFQRIIFLIVLLHVLIARYPQLIVWQGFKHTD